MDFGRNSDLSGHTAPLLGWCSNTALRQNEEARQHFGTRFTSNTARDEELDGWAQEAMGCFEIRISTILARMVKSKLTCAYAQVIIVILHPAISESIQAKAPQEGRLQRWCLLNQGPRLHTLQAFLPCGGVWIWVDLSGIVYLTPPPRKSGHNRVLACS